MASKARRHQRRNKRRIRGRNTDATLDVHAQNLLASLESYDSLVQQFGALDDPVAALDEEFTSAVAGFVDDLKGFEPHRLVEVARITYLPWAHPGQVDPPSPPAGAAHVELLALIALAAANQRPPGEKFPVVKAQEMSHFVTEASRRLDALLRLSHLRAIAAADPTDRMTGLTLRLRASQVLVRQTSYADMVQETLVQLLDGHAHVHAELIAGLGFDASGAILTLNACHEAQQAQLNARAQGFADVMNTAATQREPTEETQAAVKAAFSNLFEPDVERASVSLDAIVAESGIPEDRGRRVLEQFRLDLGTTTPAGVVDAFTSGNNPMRTHPLTSIFHGAGSGRCRGWDLRLVG